MAWKSIDRTKIPQTERQLCLGRSDGARPADPGNKLMLSWRVATSTRAGKARRVEFSVVRLFLMRWVMLRQAVSALNIPVGFASLRVVACVAWVLILTACASREPAPVEERGTQRPAVQVVEPRSYTVVRGDTLYSIAFRYGVDWRELARWNQISSPYLIHPGDRLLLAERMVAVAQAQASPPPPAPPKAAVSSSSTRNTTQKRGSARPTSAATAASKSTSKPADQPVAPANGGATTPAAAAAKSAATGTSDPGRGKDSARAPAPNQTSPADNSAKAATTAPAKSTSSGVKWQWPAAGGVKRGFVANDNTRQGVDLAGSNGDSVRAAADGVVVYSGTGLIGYGELIIIKHNDRLLSAYGHNRKRLVAEGEAVKAGQVISEMGQNSSGEAVLHFEIRVEGKPQNPLAYLPKR